MGSPKATIPCSFAWWTTARPENRVTAFKSLPIGKVSAYIKTGTDLLNRCYKTHMNLIRKLSGISASIFRAGFFSAALFMLIAYPGLSFESCPLDMKPQKSVCNCGCGCGTVSDGTMPSENGTSACSCGMTDREAVPATPLNAPATGSPENLSAPTAEIPVAAEIEIRMPGNGERDLGPPPATVSLYLRHASLRI